MKPHNKSLSKQDSIAQMRGGKNIFDPFLSYSSIRDDIVDIWFSFYLDKITKFTTRPYEYGKVWVEENALVWTYLDGKTYYIDCSKLNNSEIDLEYLPGLKALVNMYKIN